jgi:hypothetical protein
MSEDAHAGCHGLAEIPALLAVIDLIEALRSVLDS